MQEAEEKKRQKAILEIIEEQKHNATIKEQLTPLQALQLV